MRSWIMRCNALCLLAAIFSVAQAATPQALAPGDAGFSVRLPEDAGAHAAARTEWWYLTGWLDDAGHPVGFQITFFRSSIGVDANNPSSFSSHDAIFAHAALSDPRLGHVLFAQRSMRAAFGLAGAKSPEMNIHLKDWALRAWGSDHMQARLSDVNFSMALDLFASQTVLLEGPMGVSRKALSSPSTADSGGAHNDAVSAYYSLPHLKVDGSITLNGGVHRVTGEAWFDHEWSNQYLEDDAQGWDWVGANLGDGGALMAFRMRKTDGSVLYAAATRRSAAGVVRYFGPEDVAFAPAPTWKSAKSGVRYPLEQRLKVGAEQFQIKPLFDDQEIDARDSTGTLYWEGAVRLLDGNNPAIQVGQGYLELTGYASRLRL